MTLKPLKAGDIVRLKSPGYGEPEHDCVVLRDQTDRLVWFATHVPTETRPAPAFVAPRNALRVIRRNGAKREGSP